MNVNRSVKSVVFSQMQNVFRVPQGSVLGPLLFLICINDLPLSVNSSKARMFADRTNRKITVSCFINLQNKVNCELERIGRWLSANKLRLSLVKTEFLLVCSRHKAAQLTFPLKIKVGDDPIQTVTASKSVGIYIDENLTWSIQIDQFKTAYR